MVHAWWRTSVILSALGVLCLAALAQEGGDRVLGRFDFEAADAVDAWDGSERKEKGAGIERDRPQAGQACLLMAPRIEEGTYLISRAMPIPAVTERRSRMLRVRLFVRTAEARPGDAYVHVLRLYGQDRWPEWLRSDPGNYRVSTFAVLPVGPEWTQVEASGPVATDVLAISLRLGLRNTTGKARAWVDDVTVELLDVGLELQSPVHCFLYEGKEGQADVNLFLGETGMVPLVVSGAARLKAGSVRLTDEEGRNLGTLDVPRGQSRIEVPLLSRGFYALDASATYDDGTVAQVSTTAAVTGPKIPDELRLKSPFGLHSPHGDLIHLAGSGWDRDFFGMADRKDYREAFEAGFPAARKPTVQRVEPQDRKVVRCLCVQPEWLQDRKGKPYTAQYYPPKDWETFRAFVQYVVRSFEGSPHWIEVANEPDEWQGTWPELVKYHRVMAEAAKSVDPQATFLGPAFCQIEMSRVRAVVDAGLLDTIDMFSIHPYVNGTEPEGEYIGKVRELKAYLETVARRQGRPRIPICLSEYGWNLPPGDWQKPVDPLTQARFVSRSSILLVAEQIDAFIYFLTRAGEGPTTSAAGYSLLNWDYTPRPAFAAYANVARMLTGVSGPGKCLHLTPTTWLALFRRAESTLVAAWDTKGPAQVLVPVPWGQARDMMGRALPAAAEGLLSVSPSPVFVELPGLSFYEMPAPDCVAVTPGEDIPVAWAPRWCPPGFEATGSGVRVAADIAPGRYQIIGASAQGWRRLEVEARSALEIESVDLAWPAREASPRVLAVVRSNLPASAQANLECSLQGSRETATTRVALSADASSTLAVPLADLVPGRRYLGQVSVRTHRHQAQLQARRALDVTVVPCPSGPDWQKVPVMDFTHWPQAGAPADAAPAPTPEITARMQSRHDEVGLHFRIVVGDAVHQQKQSPQSMWQEDSVQLAFDLDADKPWVANAGGFAGHARVFEYGAALAPDGPMVWRWISYDKALPAGTDERRVLAHIARQGTETIYDLTFPWTVLGASTPPPAGSRLGFSFLVNDSDGATGRRSLEVFGGIGDAKDPARFGALWLR